MAPGSFERLAQRWGLDASGLFVGLLLLYVLTPLLGFFPGGRLIIELWFNLTMVLGVVMSRPKPRTFRFVLVLAALNLAIGVGNVFVHGDAAGASGVLAGPRHVLGALYMWTVFAVVFQEVLRAKEYRSSLVSSALAAYALLAFGFASLYRLLVAIDPEGSFRGLQIDEAGVGENCSTSAS